MTNRETVRFTVLTSRLIRCEWQPQGCFEDRTTQWVVSRAFPPVEHARKESGDVFSLETEALVLTYRREPGPFNGRNLSITLKTDRPVVWRHGDANSDNLGGTARTLDECDGPVCRREGRPIDIHPGIFSRSGWAVLDDSASMILQDSGVPRERGVGPVQDFYFFAYGADFAAGLRDFYTLTGRPPLLPEWSLGLWWSRWEKYRDEDLRAIVAEFEEHRIPLSVLVIDMDWHVIKNDYHGGWTGYTWNREFFPDPQSFFQHIHARGIRACLNLHPSSGAHPHEDAYEAFARFMGVDPASKAPILFNPADPKFLEGYFKFLHHPHEALGVDFWWIDWQQGKKTPFGDVDPLWVLNHLHSADLARDGRRRPFTFSRWCGPGAHRYPVGFSGDTYRTWRSLCYQVVFTASAANLGFGWWSHDIGAFARGVHDDELYLRWVQFGCFSPIFRFHNAGDPTVDHRPWSKPSAIEAPAVEALRLRRALRPYLYTCARQNADGGFPLVRPMYFHHGEDPESHQWPGQYYFGPDLLIAPVTRPAHPETNLVLHPVWLPPGDWHAFRDGTLFHGDRVYGVSAGRETVPVYARSGAMIPLASDGGEGLELICFPGESGHAELYLDDGQSLDYQQGRYVRYQFRQATVGGHWSLAVDQLGGNWRRELDIVVVLRGYVSVELTNITVNGESFRGSPECMDNGDLRVRVGTADLASLRVEANVHGTIRARPTPSKNGLVKLLRDMPLNCHFARPLVDHWERIASDPVNLAPYTADFTDEQIRVVVNYLYDAGYAVTRPADYRRHVVWWNARPGSRLAWRFDTRQEYLWKTESGDGGKSFGSHSFDYWSVFLSWRIQVDLLSAATIVEREIDMRDVTGNEPD